jgi:hypothetical protein
MSETTSAALVLVMSPNQFVSKTWKKCFRGLLKKKLLRFIALDEIHQLVLDISSCEEDFLSKFALL